MKKDDTIYVRHILDATERINEYLEGVTEAEFLQTGLLQDAVVRQLEIVGEATRNLSEELRTKHSDVPWREVIGLRNRIAHDYLNVDFQLVWEVVQYDLPILKSRVLQILGELTK